MGALLACQGATQIPTHVSPPQARSGPGNVFFAPFYRPLVHQQVHSAGSFDLPIPALVRMLRFRMCPSCTNAPGFPIDIEISMAVSPNDAEHASPVFANNVVPGTEVIVFTRKTVNLPTVPDTSWAVAPFVFDRPFIYVPAFHMSWKLVMPLLFPGGRYEVDGFLRAGSSTQTGNYAGCMGASQRLEPSLLSVPGRRVGASCSAVGLSPSAGFLAVGASASAFEGVPLPLDLGAFGAPGCSVVNDWGFLVTARLVPGLALAEFQTPNDPRLSGAVFYTQFFLFDSGANPLGIVTSDGRTNRFGAPLGISMIRALDVNATRGGVVTDYGISTALN